jgi:hypothetical protein
MARRWKWRLHPDPIRSRHSLNRASGSAASAPESGQDFQDFQDDVLLPSASLLLPSPRRGKEDIKHLPPEQIAESILDKERQIAEIPGIIKGLLAPTQ